MKICKAGECEKPSRSRGYCPAHWYKWRKYGDPLAGNTNYKTPEEAFEARTIPEPNTGCLLWFGATTPAGYGLITVRGKQVPVHRYSWEQANGPIPKGKLIDHICHTPQCVEPAHLRPATYSQNNMHRKGPQGPSLTGLRGVQGFGSRWTARVQGVYLGSFSSPEEAAEVAAQKREELFGEFAGWR